MTVYTYENETNPNLDTLRSEIDLDAQLVADKDSGDEGHFDRARWDEDETSPGCGVGDLQIHWDGDLCATCKTALDAIVAGL